MGGSDDKISDHTTSKSKGRKKDLNEGKYKTNAIQAYKTTYFSISFQILEDLIKNDINIY